MTTTERNHEIAAFIAARAPEPRYAEPRRMGVCDNCHGNHHIQQCPQIADPVAYLRAELKQARTTINTLYAACDEAHVTLFHYDLTRQPNGVDWEPVGKMREKLIKQLWQAILLVVPERNPSS